MENRRSTETTGGRRKKLTRNEELYKKAEKAVEELFNDQSVSTGKARANMRGIIDSTEILLETLGDDDEEE